MIECSCRRILSWKRTRACHFTGDCRGVASSGSSIHEPLLDWGGRAPLDSSRTSPRAPTMRRTASGGRTSTCTWTSLPPRASCRCVIDGRKPIRSSSVLSRMGLRPGPEQAEAAVVILAESFQHACHHGAAVVDVVAHGPEGPAATQELDQKRLESSRQLPARCPVAADDPWDVRCERRELRVAQGGDHIPRSLRGLPPAARAVRDRAIAFVVAADHLLDRKRRCAMRFRHDRCNSSESKQSISRAARSTACGAEVRGVGALRASSGGPRSAPVVLALGGRVADRGRAIAANPTRASFPDDANNIARARGD